MDFLPLALSFFAAICSLEHVFKTVFSSSHHNHRTHTFRNPSEHRNRAREPKKALEMQDQPRTQERIIIRRAERRDIPAIVEFQIAMALETENLNLDRELVTRGVAVPFERENVALYFVADVETATDGAAESDGGESPSGSAGLRQTVGCLMVTQEWSDWRCGTIYWIQSVYTMPYFRNRGVFKRLYNHVRSVVEGDPNIAGIRLYAEEQNERAHKVYQALGMQREHYCMFKWLKTSY